MKWRPIKTAPKDGTDIILRYPSFGDDTDPDAVCEGRWVTEVNHQAFEKWWFETRLIGAPELKAPEPHWEVAYVARIEHYGAWFGETYEPRSYKVEPTHWLPLPPRPRATRRHS